MTCCERFKKEQGLTITNVDECYQYKEGVYYIMTVFKEMYYDVEKRHTEINFCPWCGRDLSNETT